MQSEGKCSRGWVPLVVVVSDAAADVRQMVWAYLIRGWGRQFTTVHGNTADKEMTIISWYSMSMKHYQNQNRTRDISGFFIQIWDNIIQHCNPERVTPKMLSLPGDYICSQSLEMGRNLTSLNNVARKEHGNTVKQRTGIRWPGFEFESHLNSVAI